MANNDNATAPKSWQNPVPYQSITMQQPILNFKTDSAQKDLLKNNKTPTIKEDLFERSSSSMSQIYSIIAGNRIFSASDSRVTFSSQMGMSFLDGNPKCVFLPSAQLLISFAGTNTIPDGEKRVLVRDWLTTHENLLSSEKSASKNCRLIYEKLKELYQPLLQQNLPAESLFLIVSRRKKDGVCEQCSANMYFSQQLEPLSVQSDILLSNNYDMLNRLFSDHGTSSLLPLESFSEFQMEKLLCFLIRSQEARNSFCGLPNVIGGPILFSIWDKNGYRKFWIPVGETH